MSWLRAKIRSTACLALFALAVQFVLAFGHHHHEDDIRIPGVGLQGHQVFSWDPSNPATDDDDAVCAICVTVALSGTVILPTPPVLTQPNFIATVLSRPAAFALATKLRVPFGARAPPV